MPQTLEIFTSFLKEALELQNINDLLSQNAAEEQYFSECLLPSFQNLPQTLHVTNLNLLMWQVLGRLAGPALPYDFQMLLRPDRYSNEVKAILSLLADFTRLKEIFG